jgi:hypothetical protein
LFVVDHNNRPGSTCPSIFFCPSQLTEDDRTAMLPKIEELNPAHSNCHICCGLCQCKRTRKLLRNLYQESPTSKKGHICMPQASCLPMWGWEERTGSASVEEEGEKMAAGGGGRRTQ